MLSSSLFYHTDNRRLGVLHAMRMASDIGNGSQNCSDNGHIAGDISAGCVTSALSAEHRTIAAAERLQFEEWFQLFADPVAGTRMHNDRMSNGSD